MLGQELRLLAFDGSFDITVSTGSTYGVLMGYCFVHHLRKAMYPGGLIGHKMTLDAYLERIPSVVIHVFSPVCSHFHSHSEIFSPKLSSTLVLSKKRKNVLFSRLRAMLRFPKLAGVKERSTFNYANVPCFNVLMLPAPNTIFSLSNITKKDLICQYITMKSSSDAATY